MSTIAERVDVLLHELTQCAADICSREVPRHVLEQEDGVGVLDLSDALEALSAAGVPVIVPCTIETAGHDHSNNGSLTSAATSVNSERTRSASTLSIASLFRSWTELRRDTAP
jgi:hypothetical protein